MDAKFKAGTVFTLPVEFEDAHFADVSEIEFLFKQTMRGETLKSALWSRDGESRDAALVPDTTTVNVFFTMDDSYLFWQGLEFLMDTRIHYPNTPDNPFTAIIKIKMEPTLFAQGEEVT